MRRNRLAVVLAAWAFVSGVSAAVTARAQDAASSDDEARVHFRLGRAYHDSGRFPEAAREFEDAYRMSNRPQLLYNIFVAHRDAGNIPAAADALRRYLELVPNAEDRESLRARLAAMDRMLAEQRASQAAQPPPQQSQQQSVTPPPAQPPTTPQENRPPTELRRTAPSESTSESAATPPPPSPPAPASSGGGGPSPVSYAFLGVGGAMMIGGAVTGVMANDTSSRISSMCPNRVCPESLRGDVESGRTLALTTDILLFGGLGVAATGLVLMFALPQEGGDSPAATPSVSCTQDGCMGAVRGRF